MIWNCECVSAKRSAKSYRLIFDVQRICIIWEDEETTNVEVTPTYTFCTSDEYSLIFE